MNDRLSFDTARSEGGILPPHCSQLSCLKVWLGPMLLSKPCISGLSLTADGCLLLE